MPSPPKAVRGPKKTAARSPAAHPEPPAEPTRREDGKEKRLGPRGAATRAKLIEAARGLFEERGYGQVSVAQISERACVSQGTYYQYFRDRSHVMSTLVDDYVAQLLETAEQVWHLEDGRKGLELLLRHYVGHYAQNAAFAGVWEEVTQLEPTLADARRKLTNTIEVTVERQLRRGLESGVLEPLDDIAATARMLTAMADRYCYLTYVFDRRAKPPAADASARLLLEAWSRVLRIP
ncbi:TetR/AcrR family transcriptional regulator [Streptomyces sp. A1499]|uniref:TetR/AcrR family transcriptional regulator n=1 Tax=Streptomyces sp. A1499 TaxID=2563104 RepID=UPI00109ED480|nr:TetR/AcrR family transcriptional regulator [Streptomyces sp. A1499]THC43100.1 TetR/AcrR family transcriptional regulator [Streptomyces sp. A1499]